MDSLHKQNVHFFIIVHSYILNIIVHNSSAPLYSVMILVPSCPFWLTDLTSNLQYSVFPFYRSKGLESATTWHMTSWDKLEFFFSVFFIYVSHISHLVFLGGLFLTFWRYSHRYPAAIKLESKKINCALSALLKWGSLYFYIFVAVLLSIVSQSGLRRPADSPGRAKM